MIVLCMSKDFSCFMTFNTGSKLTTVSTSMSIAAHTVRHSALLWWYNRNNVVSMVAILPLRTCKGWCCAKDRLIHAVLCGVRIPTSLSHNHRLVHKRRGLLSLRIWTHSSNGRQLQVFSTYRFILSLSSSSVGLSLVNLCCWVTRLYSMPLVKGWSELTWTK
jgi:hypothetical protein